MDAEIRAEIARIIRAELPRLIRDEIERRIEDRAPTPVPREFVDATKLGRREWLPSDAYRVFRTVVTPTARQPLLSVPAWVGRKKPCPHCGKTKLLIEEFGVKTRNGVLGVQSWCRVCRAKPSEKKPPA